ADEVCLLTFSPALSARLAHQPHSQCPPLERSDAPWLEGRVVSPRRASSAPRRFQPIAGRAAYARFPSSRAPALAWFRSPLPGLRTAAHHAPVAACVISACVSVALRQSGSSPA